MGENKQLILLEDTVDKRSNVSKRLVIISSYIACISYVYLLIRRLLLLTDASLEAFASAGFLNRNNLLTNQDILANFTIAFDTLQVVTCIVILIGFILMIKIIEIKNRKYLIRLIVCFSILIVAGTIRTILIHLDPSDYWPLGEIFGGAGTYYEYAFVIFSTDSLRITIMVLLIIANNSLTNFSNVRDTGKERFSSKFLLVLIIIFIIVIVFGGLSFDQLLSVVTYYIHYTVNILIHIGHVLIYFSIANNCKQIFDSKKQDILTFETSTNNL